MDEGTRSHLQLLSIFHYVLAGLSALFSLLPIVYVVMGMAIVTGSVGQGDANAPPNAFGWIFVAVGATLMATGVGYVVLVAMAGRFIARRRHWTYCVVVAGISCIFFPFGTVLGVFTIVVLARPEVKAAFQASAAPLPTTAVAP